MATKLVEYNLENHFCPNCNAVLDEQSGFNAKDDCWTCTKCGQLLYGEVYEGEKYPGVMWFCNQCKELLNKQEGFRDCLDGWTCVKCGCHEDFALTIKDSKGDITFKEKVVDTLQKSKPILKKAAKWTIGIGVAVGVAILAKKFSENTSEKNAETTDCDSDEATHDNFRNIVPQVNPRYKVEYKSFKTGEWYTKTETDNLGGAYSVASDYNSYGRAYRLIDTHIDQILKESDEDAGMAESNGYPNGYPW